MAVGAEDRPGEMGSLRNTFDTQAALHVFAMDLVVERIEQRLDALPPDDDTRAAAERFLTELLPLDDDRREENAVWLAFTARAMVDPALRECGDKGYDALRAGCRRWVVALAGDGLAVHAAMRPEQATPDRLRATLAAHLRELGRPSS
jgi:hypothetical protein